MTLHVTQYTRDGNSLEYSGDGIEFSVTPIGHERTSVRQHRVPLEDFEDAPGGLRESNGTWWKEFTVGDTEYVFFLDGDDVPAFLEANE